MMTNLEYQVRPILETSLFKSDQEVLSEEAISRILSSKIQLSQKAKLALMKFPYPEGRAQRYYGSYYWRSEDYLKTQQEYIDIFSAKFSISDRIQEVILLPSLMTPKEPTIPILREAAVRLQADLLLVFRITSDIYEQYVFFGKDKAKAYSTVEAVLLDVRTGIIPFSLVVTREHTEFKQEEDINFNETMKRAEKEAVIKALNAVGEELSVFLSMVPD